MNKAFTRESDEEVLEPLPEIVDPLPAGVANYVTPGGGRALRERLRRLEEERPAMEADLAEVRHLDGTAGKEARLRLGRRLQELDREIRYLQDHVARMEVVDPGAQDPDVVRFGATVVVLDGGDREREVTICGVDEADPDADRLSWLSPVAKALIGARVGEEVTLRLPRGREVLEVLEIRYGGDAG